MIPSNLDPTHFTALHSLDLGNVLSMDGRAHPLDAMTPVSVSVENVPATIVPAGTSTGPNVPPVSLPGDGTPAGMNVGFGSMISGIVPENFGARLSVAFVGVVIIALVAARFIFSPE